MTLNYSPDLCSFVTKVAEVTVILKCNVFRKPNQEMLSSKLNQTTSVQLKSFLPATGFGKVVVSSKSTRMGSHGLNSISPVVFLLQYIYHICVYGF